MLEKFVDSPNGKVYYWLPDVWIEGGQTLFVLHGMTGDHTMFEKQAEYFSKDHNVILWDAPAHGKSRPFQDFNYDKAARSIKKI